MIHTCTKLEEFIENKNLCSSILIFVLHQTSGNMQILQRVVAINKQRHAATLAIHLAQPKQYVSPHEVLARLPNSACAYVPKNFQCSMCTVMTLRLFTCQKFLLIPVVYGYILTVMFFDGRQLNNQHVADARQHSSKYTPPPKQASLCAASSMVTYSMARFIPISISF